MPYDDLTDEQRTVIADAEAAIARIVAQAQEKLTETGLDLDPAPPPEEGDFSCRRCSCAGFLSGPRPGFACARRECGHSFTTHRVQ
jgi:hypothetical protein